jgi:hypothetical protein
VVVDLVAEVAGREVKQRSPVDVGRVHHLAQVPPNQGFAVELLLGEHLGAFGEVAAEDGRMRPHVACHVREEVAEQGGTNAGPASTTPSRNPST